MRTTLEHNDAYRQRHTGFRYAASEQALHGPYVISQEGPNVYFLNPMGTNKTVFLPEVLYSGGQHYIIGHRGTGGNLLLVDSVGAEVFTIPPGGLLSAYSTPTGDWMANLLGVTEGEPPPPGETTELPFVNLEVFGPPYDGAALLEAVRTGETVVIPSELPKDPVSDTILFEIPEGANLAETTTNVLDITRALWRIDAYGLTTIKLPKGHFNVTDGDLGRVGWTSRNIRLVGEPWAPAQFTHLKAPDATGIGGVQSVSGSAGNWTVELNLNDATNIEVGDVIKLWNISPLPNLSGNNVFLLTQRPRPNELATAPSRIGTIIVTEGASTATFRGRNGAPTVSIQGNGAGAATVLWPGNLMLPGESFRFVHSHDPVNPLFPPDTLPPGVVRGRLYYVLPTSFDVPPDTFTFSASAGGAPVSTGTNTLTGKHYGAPNIANQLAINNLLIYKGQLRRITAVGTTADKPDRPDTVTVHAPWIMGTPIASSEETETRGYWYMRQNSGTISATGSLDCKITGAGTFFMNQANAGADDEADPAVLVKRRGGDLLVFDGGAARILKILSDTEIITSHPVQIPAGSFFGVLTAAVLHEGAHVVTGVDLPNNRVTVKNKSRTKPPLYRVGGPGVFEWQIKVCKTVLWNQVTNVDGKVSNGLVFDQGASLRYMDHLALRGPETILGGVTRGVAMNGVIPEDTYTSTGMTGWLTTGQGFASINWGECVFVGHGCSFISEGAALCGADLYGVWGMDGSHVVLRHSVLSHNGRSGAQMNPNSTLTFTEGRACGNDDDGIRLESGATCYAEIPFFWGNVGMNVRSLGATMQINEGVSHCSVNSGVYADHGDVLCARMQIFGNGRAGIEDVQLSRIVCEEVWVSGTKAPGIICHTSSVMAPESAITYNTVGISDTQGSMINVTGSMFKQNVNWNIGNSTRTKDASIHTQSTAIMSGCRLTQIEVDKGGIAWINDAKPLSPATEISLLGVLAVNALSVDGAAVWDGIGTILRLPPVALYGVALFGSSADASIDNLTVAGMATKGVIELSTTVPAGANLTGISIAPMTPSQADGRIFVLSNNGNNDIRLKHFASESLINNRFYLGSGPTTRTLEAGQVVLLRYNQYSTVPEQGYWTVFDPPDAAETSRGIQANATTAEAQTGTAVNKTITPATLSAVVGSAAFIGQGRHSVWIPASAMVPRTTNGAAPGLTETTTNKNMLATLDFDPSITEYAQFTIGMPKSWDEGSVSFIPYWTADSGTASVIGTPKTTLWTLAAVATGTGNFIDAAFGTAGVSPAAHTAGSTSNAYIGPGRVFVGDESGAFTAAGNPAAGDRIQFQVSRAAGSGSDTHDADARLLGVKLLMTYNAKDDA